MPFILKLFIVLGMSLLASCAKIPSINLPESGDVFSSPEISAEEHESAETSATQPPQEDSPNETSDSWIGNFLADISDLSTFSSENLDNQTASSDSRLASELDAIEEEVENQNSAQLHSHTDLLERIRAGFKLDIHQDHPDIDAQVAWYTKNQGFLSRALKRSEKYLHHIVEEIEAKGMPLEVALLPIVESAFDPFAYSHGRAAGLWQFIPGTGRMYGLNQNWWYDGRRGILTSTDAALRYLTVLNDTFEGDWLQSLASYNAGEGTVLRAIKKNRQQGKATDFWSLDLPKETSGYVPKLLAIARIIENPEKYGIELPAIPNQPYFDVVNVGSQIDLAQAAKMANMDVKEIYQLNPAFNRWATSPLGPHRLLVPVEKVEIFKENLEKLPAEKRLSWQRYKIQTGDSLIKIAKKFKTTPEVIKNINHINGNSIRKGKTLLIPMSTRSLATVDGGPEGKQTSTAKVVYTVKGGDNLWNIARKYDVDYKKLAEWNGLSAKSTLKAGQKLSIWAKKPDSPIHLAKSDQGRALIKKVKYEVRSGDSLGKIAGKFRLKTQDIAGWNNITSDSHIRPGQKLTLFVDITSSN